MYEYHGDLNTQGNIRWYVGFGAQASLYRDATGSRLDGVVGIDIKLPRAPLNIGIDWQPSVELGVGNSNGFAASYGGVAIRYTL